MKIGSLCTGYGGLDMGVQAAIGGETVWVSDIDKGANKILAHRFPELPNLGDFTAVDWSTVEPVDVLTAGFPCQPVSHAGKRLGDQDERWLWDDVAHAVRSLRPGLVVLENVRGLLTARGGRLFGRVLGSLADLGYDASWHGLRAADIGAAHGRYRVFIAAWDTHRSGLEGRRAGGRTDQRPPGARVGPRLTLLPTPAVNDMGAGKTVERWDEWTAAMKAKHGNGNGHGKSLAIEAQRTATGWGPYEAAVRRWESVTGRPAPAPTEPTMAGAPRISPLFTEWMMGLPAGHVTDVPGITRNEALKALGNGVVPQQATAALREMLSWAVAA